MFSHSIMAVFLLAAAVHCIPMHQEEQHFGQVKVIFGAKSFEVTVSESYRETFADLKELIFEYTNIAVADQVLFFDNEEVDEWAKLHEYGFGYRESLVLFLTKGAKHQPEPNKTVSYPHNVFKVRLAKAQQSYVVSVNESRVTSVGGLRELAANATGIAASSIALSFGRRLLRNDQEKLHDIRDARKPVVFVAQPPTSTMAGELFLYSIFGDSEIIRTVIQRTATVLELKQALETKLNVPAESLTVAYGYHELANNTRAIEKYLGDARPPTVLYVAKNTELKY